MMRQGAGYTVESFRQCLFGDAPFELLPADQWSDDAWHKDQEKRVFRAHDGWWCIQPGEAEGTLIGGSCWCLNMLQGTRYFPSLGESILFLEQPGEGKATLMALDSGLRSLSFQKEFSHVRAIVLGRYASSCGVTRANLTELIRQVPALKHIPVMANGDFGHTTPAATLPIGGRCRIRVAATGCAIRFSEH